jgi:hypothetical protein
MDSMDLVITHVCMYVCMYVCDLEGERDGLRRVDVDVDVDDPDWRLVCRSRTWATRCGWLCFNLTIGRILWRRKKDNISSFFFFSLL